MDKESLQRLAAIRASLTEYLRGLRDGETVSYMEIEVSTGVSMHVKGYRKWLRPLARALGREITVTPGCGIRMSCADTALDIARTCIDDIARSGRRALLTTERLCQRHGKDMSPDDRKRLSDTSVALRTVDLFTSKETARLLVNGSSAKKG